MKAPPKITPAESVVMDAIWRKSPRSADELVQELGPAQGWSEATVRTLIRRLVQKKALNSTPDGRRFLFSPLVGRDAWVHAESGGLVDRLFEGRLAPFLMHFSERRKLSAQDVAELKALIKELGDGE